MGFHHDAAPACATSALRSWSIGLSSSICHMCRRSRSWYHLPSFLDAYGTATPGALCTCLSHWHPEGFGSSQGAVGGLSAPVKRRSMNAASCHAAVGHPCG